MPQAPPWFDPTAPLESAVRYLSTQSPRFNWVGIYILHGDGLHLGPFVGAPTEHRHIRIGQGICGTAVALGEDLNIPDVTRVGNYLACSTETQSELVVLIRDRSGAVVGQIDIDSHTPAAFGPDEEATVRGVALQLGNTWPS